LFGHATLHLNYLEKGLEPPNRCDTQGMVFSPGFGPVIPYVLISGAILLFGVVTLLMKVDEELASEMIFNIGLILLGVLFVVMIVGNVCMTIHPVEHFSHPVEHFSHPVEHFSAANDSNGSNGNKIMKSLFADIASSEKDVCTLITRSNEFIQSDVGPPGVDDPTLVSAAIEKARVAAGGELTDCATTGPVSGQLKEAENRIVRLEHTIQGFTRAPIGNAYEHSDTCGNIKIAAVAGPPGISGAITPIDILIVRLKNIIRMITEQKLWLKKIDDKREALQRGEVSDCDKALGNQTYQSSLPQSGT